MRPQKASVQTSALAGQLGPRLTADLRRFLAREIAAKEAELEGYLAEIRNHFREPERAAKPPKVNAKNAAPTVTAEAKGGVLRAAPEREADPTTAVSPPAVTLAKLTPRDIWVDLFGPALGPLFAEAPPQSESDEQAELRAIRREAELVIAAGGGQ